MRSASENLVGTEVPQRRHRQTEDHARPREGSVEVVNQVERVLTPLIVWTLHSDVIALEIRRWYGKVSVHERCETTDLSER